MVKEADLDTINIYDSDENDDANDDDVVVVLDSDSTDGGDSEIISDASEATDEDNVRDIDDDVIISSDDDDYYDSDGSVGSGDFVVTQRVKNCAQPTTIDLNADDVVEHTSPEPDQKKNDATDVQIVEEMNEKQKSDDVASSTSTSAIATEKEVTTKSNGTAGETNSTEGDAKATEGDANTSETIANITDRNTNTVEGVKEPNESATKVFRSDTNERRGIQVISAQPLKKRRRTITESEYEDSKKQREQKRLARAERLAQIAIDAKEKQATTAASNGNDADFKRPVAVPKVKISQVSRAEMLATDMLADSTK